MTVLMTFQFLSGVKYQGGYHVYIYLSIPLYIYLYVLCVYMSQAKSVPDPVLDPELRALLAQETTQTSRPLS